jgi:hypothetical protein
MELSSPFSSMLRVNSPSASESMSWRSWYGLSSSCSSGISVMPASLLAFGFAWRARASAFHSAIVAFASGPFRFADCLWTTDAAWGGQRYAPLAFTEHGLATGQIVLGARSWRE